MSRRHSEAATRESLGYMRSALVRPLFAIAAVALAVSACSGGSAPSDTACGWDLSTQAGKDASAARMDEAARWINEHPGEPIPEPTSEYWHGECPTTATPSPPDEENEGGA